MNITVRDFWLLQTARPAVVVSGTIYLLKYNEMRGRFRLMEPDTQLLTRWEISPEGDVISYGFADCAGEANHSPDVESCQGLRHDIALA